MFCPIPLRDHLGIGRHLSHCGSQRLRLRAALLVHLLFTLLLHLSSSLLPFAIVILVLLIFVVGVLLSTARVCIYFCFCSSCSRIHFRSSGAMRIREFDDVARGRALLCEFCGFTLCISFSPSRLQILLVLLDHGFTKLVVRIRHTRIGKHNLMLHFGRTQRSRFTSPFSITPSLLLPVPPVKLSVMMLLPHTSEAALDLLRYRWIIDYA